MPLPILIGGKAIVGLQSLRGDAGGIETEDDFLEGGFDLIALLSFAGLAHVISILVPLISVSLRIKMNIVLET